MRPATRAAALAFLAACVPRLGAAYAEGRNTDAGPDAPPAVSGLSPYVRHRLLTEGEVVAAARAAHGAAARRFVQEVFWRTYWKGWLEARPAVWDAYRATVRQGVNRLATESGLRRTFHMATEGQTGIACFDAWARDLVAHNWLHNHARMWFASIWCFTLRLPWALGADFFLRHLLDGDAASNTLSWRWVAGLHTPGKHYVARAENIRRHTAGRFDPAGDLDESPAPLEEHPSLAALPAVLPAPAAPPRGPVALLLHQDDLSGEHLPPPAPEVRALAVLAAPDASVAHGTAEAVRIFRAAALEDGRRRAEAAYRLPAARLGPEALPDWARAVGLPVVALHAPAGGAADLIAASGVAVTMLRRGWDARAWPHCGRGFFQLDRHIPALCAAADAERL